MARPKKSTPPMQHLTITVTAETRALLSYVAGGNGKSISAMVAEWAAREAKRIARQRGTSLPLPPDPEQTALE